MEQRRIGHSDLVTSVIGFGTWEMSTTMYGDIDRLFEEEGVPTHVDTPQALSPPGMRRRA